MRLYLGKELDCHNVTVHRSIHGNAVWDEDILADTLRRNPPLGRVESIHPQSTLRQQALVPLGLLREHVRWLT